MLSYNYQHLRLSRYEVDPDPEKADIEEKWQRWLALSKAKEPKVFIFASYAPADTRRVGQSQSGGLRPGDAFS